MGSIGESDEPTRVTTCADGYFPGLRSVPPGSGITMRLVAPSLAVSKVLGMTGLKHNLTIWPDRSGALCPATSRALASRSSRAIEDGHG